MRKKDIGDFPEFFDRYIHKTPDVDLLSTLEDTQNLFDDIAGKLKTQGLYAYEKDKWTVNQVLQHVIDNERIQSSRALRIMRGDKTPLPGYNQDIIARDTYIPKKDTEELLQEYALVRNSTLFLFRHIPDEMLQRKGLCSNIEISALAIGFVISGHAIHHKNILLGHYLL